MTINNQNDWWKLAINTILLLPDYMSEFNLTFDDDRAREFVEHKSHNELWQLFNAAWWDLPDRGDIRYGPFFDLCDLCSEYWVFGEGGE